MGNRNSAQPPNIQKSHREGRSNADIEKGKQAANGSGKATGQSSQNKLKIQPRATNPFIIFFLQLCGKNPNEHVTVIARAAGKQWSQMTFQQRKKYVDLANEEKKLRQQRKRKRKRSSRHSKMK